MSPGTGHLDPHVQDAGTEFPWLYSELTTENFEDLGSVLNTHSRLVSDHEESNDEFHRSYSYAREVGALAPVLVQSRHLTTSLQQDIIDSTREIGAGAIGNINGPEIRRAIPTHSSATSPQNNEVKAGPSTAMEVSVFPIKACAVPRLLTCTQTIAYRYAPLSVAWLFSEAYGCTRDHAPFVLKTASPSPPAMQLLQQNVHQNLQR